jgi:curved DNA-binding protein CbpA
MSDPYKILGIGRDASEDEIKGAYRELAKKYHPDSYRDNPLSDLAAEKMKEINEAYDVIMLERRGGGIGQTSGGAGAGSSQFHDIRRMVMAKRITEAEELLDGVPQHSRDAEWHFLKGSVQYTRGWLDEAYENFNRAASMNPGNTEYRSALNRLEWQRRTGSPHGGGYRTNPNTRNCDVCDFCSAMICADCCCQCMGGRGLCC